MQEALKKIQPAGPAEIVKILAEISLFKRIPNTQTPEQVNYFLGKYAERLKPYSVETLRKAANELIDVDKSDWFPQPARMIELCNEYHQWYKADAEKLQATALLQSTYSDKRKSNSETPDQINEVDDHVAETMRILRSKTQSIL